MQLFYSMQLTSQLAFTNRQKTFEVIFRASFENPYFSISELVIIGIESNWITARYSNLRRVVLLINFTYIFYISAYSKSFYYDKLVWWSNQYWWHVKIEKCDHEIT